MHDGGRALCTSIDLGFFEVQDQSLVFAYYRRVSLESMVGRRYECSSVMFLGEGAILCVKHSPIASEILEVGSRGVSTVSIELV